MSFQNFVGLLVLMVCLRAESMYHRQTKTVSNVQNHFVFPGTKWCGKGNNAMAYNDLGKHNRTDDCCRTHDHCPTYIPAFKRRYGLLNFNAMQMSHCSCEEKLFDCLWKLKNPVSTAVGRLYFNVFRNPCFKLVETRVCVNWIFDWWNFSYYCGKYGTQIKAKKIWLNNYLRKFPDNDNSINRTTTVGMPGHSTGIKVDANNNTASTTLAPK
ncbi:phospholipase A2 isozymes PA3A/PA3B/PA5 [Exaiptasia diaphana]|uniref:phospholipase A2 n=1 Tax=Exaiptasia diaphana TaxID=2652724 RepID=A0A913Y511_EXADI|nr:phospholipase A2 isozymes PA3A/PA3B/PA5 [Exaiptasia diaphana]